MPFDGIMVSAIATELQGKILNGKIEKIYQPESDEINILIRCLGKKYKLLISASSKHPRIHLTNLQKLNPQSPPMFCMLMRKHLQGGKILNIEQQELERIITIDIESYDELGFIETKQLIIELMGRHSNITLIQKEDQKIIDSIKRISAEINRYREILPGKTYVSPPDQGKQNPKTIDFETFCETLKKSNSEFPVFKGIYTSMQGISPLTAKEVCYNANIADHITLESITEQNYHDLWASFEHLLSYIRKGDFSPTILITKQEKQVTDFLAIPFCSTKDLYDTIQLDSISTLLEDYYIKKDLYNRLKQKSIDLHKLISHTLTKLYNKNKKLNKELSTSMDAPKYKILGELLTANLHLVKKGDLKIDVLNFYDPLCENICISLNKQLSPSQNAQKYFKKYNKFKNAQKEIQNQLQETNQEIQYFETIAHTLETVSNLGEIEEIRNELIEEGYIRKRKRNKSNKVSTSKPLKFTSTDGFDLFVGKNNKQNDYLTLKFSSKKDLWFHTKDIPGSHVIISTKGCDVPEKTILEAAELSAFHSKAKMSSNVAIDYTQVKNVKKPNAAKPGMVIYENNKTIYITPRYNIHEILSANNTPSNL